MTDETVAVTYLEMRSPVDPAPAPDPGGLTVQQARRPNLALNRALYSMVGESYRWLDRTTWSTDEWSKVVTADGYQTWLGYVDGSPIGYFELDAATQPDVEIVYFGLLPAFIGQGLGGPFLRQAINAAWSVDGAERVWLHTCTDDHPRALPNYLAAGFAVYDERIE